MEDENSCSSPRRERDQHQAVGHLQRFGDGSFETLFDGGFAAGAAGRGPAASARRGLEQNAVDDGLDGVVLAPVEQHGLGEVAQFAIDAGAKPLLIELIEQVLEFALAAAHDGRHDGDAFAGAELQDALHDLLGGLARDGPAAVGAVRRAHGGVEQAQVVVDLGDGADGRSRAAAGGLLLDGDGRAEAFDGIHVGPLDLIEELPRVGRERLDVAALPFGVDGVEGQRALARAGQTGDHRQRVAGNADVDVAQVVLARAAYRNVSDGHDEAKWERWVEHYDRNQPDADFNVS